MNVYAVLPVHRRVLGGAAHFRFEGTVCGLPFSYIRHGGWTLSELRENVHVPILSTLSSSDYSRLFHASKFPKSPDSERVLAS